MALWRDGQAHLALQQRFLCVKVTTLRSSRGRAHHAASAAASRATAALDLFFHDATVSTDFTNEPAGDARARELLADPEGFDRVLPLKIVVPNVGFR